MANASQSFILEDIRVIEVGGGIAVGFCGRLLAALGADVVKIEPPGGDDLRWRGPFAPADRTQEHGGLFLYLNADKRSVTLDVASAEGHRLLGRLIERAGVVLLGLAPQEQERLGLSAKGLRAGREGLVVTSLTPFGTKGPYKDYRSYDLTAIHWGGLAHITPRFNSDPEQEPLRPDGYLSEFIAGLHGALATVAAALRCDGPGAGGAGLDISTWEAVLYNLPLRIAERTYARTSSPRLSKPTFAPFHFFRCRDGYVFIMTTERHQWDALVELMGKPEWALADYLQDGVARAEAWDAIEPLISDFLKDYTAEELYRKGSALRLPCAPAVTVAEFVAAPHMAARSFFTTVVEPGLGEVAIPGSPVRMTGTPMRLAHGAPRPGEHNADILGGELGLGSDELVALRSAGVA